MALAGHTAQGFAVARILGRLGDWPMEADWLGLNPIHAFGYFLENARQTPLEPWLESLHTGQDVHEIERALRLRLAASLDELNDWIPASLQDAVAWFRYLPYLPFLAYLLQGNEAHDWMYRDEILAAWLGDRRGLQASDLQSTPVAGLAPAEGQALDLDRRWKEGLIARLPEDARADLGDPALRDGLDALLQGHPLLSSGGQTSRGAEVHDALRRYVHLNLEHPTIAVAYAAMLVWAMQRLHSELVVRRLFDAREGVV